jgi:hypothetical protein
MILIFAFEFKITPGWPLNMVVVMRFGPQAPEHRRLA